MYEIQSIRLCYTLQARRLSNLLAFDFFFVFNCQKQRNAKNKHQTKATTASNATETATLSVVRNGNEH